MYVNIASSKSCFKMSPPTRGRVSQQQSRHRCQKCFIYSLYIRYQWSRQSGFFLGFLLLPLLLSLLSSSYPRREHSLSPNACPHAHRHLYAVYDKESRVYCVRGRQKERNCGKNPSSAICEAKHGYKCDVWEK